MKFAPQASHALNPLFWQRGDSHEAIGEEMERMKSVGINDFVVEPRPHPDYLGEGWWRDVDFIINKAEELDMLVWFFDDGVYPSGCAFGKLAEKYPEHTKRFLAEEHMDAVGPLPHAHFYVDNWLAPGEELFAVLAARRSDGDAGIFSETLVDLTSFVSHGRLYWAVPEGRWRVFVIRKTRAGLEAETVNYVNPLSREGVSKYIELVHEEFFKRYGHLFGTRVQGFFTDEPRFGNIPGYNVTIGSCKMPLPYVDGLMDQLSACPLGDFTRFLPLLWFPDAEGVCRDARYAYMDTVSRLFGENFTGQLGDWCRAHGVRLVGHVVEENGAHSRLGYGAGHYFRAMKGLDAAGIDVVDNLMPEETDGHYITMFNNYDCDFNHWGLAKMASSASHADPKKNGNTLCEAFGAYGWFEGLRLMKWITDHLAVQGVNILTPHAFSPFQFPDPDCPPHFYARGENPQFKLFHVWSDYARRLLDVLTDARHVAPAAVVYHAEGEWGGQAEPFERAVKVLARAQIDCDVVCIDDLLTASVTDGVLTVGAESFRVLIVPGCESVPPAFAEKLADFAKNGLPVFFTERLPARCYFGGAFAVDGVKAIPTERIAKEAAPYASVCASTEEPDLLCTHYRKNGTDVYLFVNQSTRRAVDTCVTLPDDRPALLYDAMTDTSLSAAQTTADGKSSVRLHLEAWESRMIVFGADTEGLPVWTPAPPTECLRTLEDGWRISTAASKEYPSFTPTPFTATGDLSRPDRLPDFSGTVRYERKLTLPQGKRLLLDLGDAYEAVRVELNGKNVAEFICPPYVAALPQEMIREGENDLVIEVTNTLVKAQNRNPFDRYFVQDPTGLVDPVRLLAVIE